MKTLKYGFLVFAGIFGLVACDGGGDGDNNNQGGNQNEINIPPTDLSPVSNENTSNPDNSGANVSLTDTYVNELLSKINDSRAAEGLAPLIIDVNISNFATEHSQFMAQQAQASGGTGIVISHDNFEDRAIATFALGYNSYGENVGAVRGYAANEVTDALVVGWNNSPGHRANIVGDFTHTGLGVFIDVSDGTIYVTQIFAKLP